MTRKQIREIVLQNLDETGVSFYSEDDINQSIQDGYNIFAAFTGAILKTATIAKIGSPYLKVTDTIPDFMYLVGLWNYETKSWLEPTTRKYLDNLRWDWELWNGEPFFVCPLDFYRLAMVPALEVPTGNLLMVYRAKANTLSDNITPVIPKEVESILVQYATADSLEQSREFNKAKIYRDEWNRQLLIGRSTVKHAQDPDLFRVLGDHGFNLDLNLGAVGTDITAETPTGTVDGTNYTFTLAYIPMPLSSLSVYIDSVLVSTDLYTVDGSTIDFATAPSLGSSITVNYRIE